MEDRLARSQTAELSDEVDRIQSPAVTREGKRPLAALLAAVLAATLLAACGGSDSDSSSATEATAPDAAATTGTTTSSDEGAGGESQTQGSQPQKHGQGQGGDKGRAGSGADRSQSGSGSGSKDVETPLKVSGGGAEQFRTKGGDNSIQEFGAESDESELQEAAEAVHGFYVARAEGQWETACSYLSKSNIEGLEKLASQSRRSQGADCATVLEAFTRPLPAEVEREITTVDAGSLRREGDQGFLIYYGAGHETYAMPLKEEGGSWKLTALSGTTLS